MRGKYRLLPLIVLALLAGPVACLSAPTTGPESNLGQALTLAPADALQVDFTDWGLIKEYVGAQDLSSESSDDEKLAFLRTVGKDQAAAAGYGVDVFVFSRHAEVWGWDTTDLVWEAKIWAADRAPVHLLKFPSDFDFDPVLALFDERGFTQSKYRDVVVYSHELDLKADWLLGSLLPVNNTAVLMDERVFVLSASVEDVHAVLDAYRGGAGALADDEAIQSVASRLNEAAAAVVIAHVDADTCPCSPLAQMERFVPPEEFVALEETLSGLHGYTAFGLGYRYEDDQAVNVMVMHFADAGDAQADLEARRQVAEEGSSFALQVLYRDMFVVDEASVQGSDLVLRLQPAGNRPQVLFAGLMRRDVSFAYCP